MSFSPLQPGRKAGGICGSPIRAHSSLGDGNEPGSRHIETGQCLDCPFQPGRQVSCRSWELAAQRSSNLAPRWGPREARRGRARWRSSRRRFQSGRSNTRVGGQRPPVRLWDPAGGRLIRELSASPASARSSPRSDLIGKTRRRLWCIPARMSRELSRCRSSRPDCSR